MSTEEALRRAATGDSEALEVLILAYEGKVYSFAYHLTGNADDARDLSQEVLLRVISSIKSFRGDCPFSSWVFRIANNVFIDRLRRKSRLKFYSLDERTSDGEGRPPLEPVSLECDPSDWVQRSEMRAMVREAMGKLHPGHRAIVVMHDVQGMKYRQIAEVLDCPVGTVKSRLNRARAALRMELIDMGYVQNVRRSVRSRAALTRAAEVV